jgi:hypothetical protein
VPAGPDFQDPQPVDNQRPYAILVAGAPVPESAVALTAKSDITFAISFGDANLDDTLMGRWVANYPPYSLNGTALLADRVASVRATTQGHPATFTKGFNCVSGSFMGAADPNLVFIVSDRGFRDPDMTTTPPPALPFNIDGNGNPTLVMIGWRITGCQ